MRLNYLNKINFYSELRKKSSVTKECTFVDICNRCVVTDFSS